MANSVPLRVVMGILGYSTIVMTSQYAHVLNDVQRQAGSILDGLYGGAAEAAD